MLDMGGLSDVSSEDCPKLYAWISSMGSRYIEEAAAALWLAFDPVMGCVGEESARSCETFFERTGFL